MQNGLTSHTNVRTMKSVPYEWDPKKNKANIRKHGISLADAVSALEDECAITITDHESDPGEVRFITLGLDAFARILVVVYTWRGETIRIISARKAGPSEREEYEAKR